ncbi:MAG: Asp/Glu racemase [Gammaproteobacteria bacterium]|nr:Asp/Glu racemase [Gammaproteobacteria bacterium]
MSSQYTNSRGRARIGVVVPVTNTNLEPDLQLLRPDGVSIHFARSGGYDVDAIPDEKQMQQYSDADYREVVDQLRICRSDIILYGCTSATLAQGPDFDEEFRGLIEQQTSTPTVTAASSLVEALTDLGIGRFAFTSPYVASLNDFAVSFIEHYGFSCVSRLDTPNPLSNNAVAEITPEQVLEMAIEVNSSEAEAIVLSCTDMRATEAIEAIEQKLGKPVITSNQAMMHAALKRLSIPHTDSIICHHLLTKNWLNQQG